MISFKLKKKGDKIYAIANGKKYPFWVDDEFEFFEGWNKKGILADGKYGEYLTVDDGEDYDPMSGEEE